MAAKAKHGGARPNSGRKSKREEDKLTSLFDAAITEEDLIAAFKAVVRSAKLGNVQALKELLDRRFGKVVDKTEVTGQDGGAMQIILREVINQTNAND